MSTSQEKAKPIRLLILDVDGVMTNGYLHYTNNGEEMKGFHIHDGMGLKLLQKANIALAVISGKNSPPVQRRIEELNIEHCYLGHNDKLPVYEALKKKLGLSDNVIAYMGDDLPDLPILKRVGFAITVREAPSIIKEHADFITTKKAGKGAVREACEFILVAQNLYESMLQSYLF